MLLSSSLNVAAILPWLTVPIAAEAVRAGRAASYNACLERKTGYRASSSHHLYHERLSRGSSLLTDVDSGQVFVTPISFGDQERQVVVDTGSSDTWMVAANFDCFNASTSQSVPESDCMFGDPVGPISNFTKIPDENLNITYADGETLYGDTGLTQVTVAGITVPGQQVSLIHLAAWDGDGVSSGLLGLSYPAITSVFHGANGSADNISTNAVHYSPIVSTMISQNLIAPIFSIAISRDASNQSNGGLIEFGDIPCLSQADINATSGFVNTSIQQINSVVTGSPEFLFYALEVEAIASSETTCGNSSGTYIVDSGTTLLYVPTQVAQYLNAQFDPPARYDQDAAAYLVNCTAQSFSMGFEIGGGMFGINPQDLIANQYDQSDSECVSGIQDGGDGSEGPFVLGDVFLKNVLVVFDIQTEIMSIASRMYYDS